MRSLLALAILGAAAPAAASPEGDVEALVRGTVDHLADGKSTDAFAKQAIVIGFRANVWDLDSMTRLSGEHGMDPLDEKTNGKLWPLVFGYAKPTTTRKLGKVTVLVDATGRTAWYAAPMELSDKRTMHVTGSAVFDGGVWKLKVFDAELSIPDKDLANYPVLAARPMMTVHTSTNALAKAIASWFVDHSLAKHAAAGTVLASGSAPSEIFLGAAATKFAASLDKLDLIPVWVEGSDSAVVIHGTAWLPISKQERDGVISFGFTVYAELAGADWRWRAIHFADDQTQRSEYPR